MKPTGIGTGTRIGRGCLVTALLVLIAAPAAAADGMCAGDCNDDGEVTINELINGVNIALATLDLGTCEALDANRSGSIEIDDLILGVNNALYGCEPQPQFTVTKTEDTNDGVCDDDCSLREAIVAANASRRPAEVDTSLAGNFGVTFRLTLEGADEDEAATGDLDITANLTLKLRNAVIDGNAADRVFHIHSGAIVRIVGGAIRNGSAVAGAGIFNAGTLLLEDSTVSANSATPDECCGTRGGGVFNEGTLTLTDSLVSDNAVVGVGAGLANAGTLTLVNSTVSGNSAIWPGYRARGGGIFNGYGSQLSLTDSRVSENSADEGGGIYDDIGGTVILTNSALVGNSANNDGGGIYNGGGISDQGDFGAVTLRDSTVSGNSASERGGGYYTGSFGWLTLVKSTLSWNLADEGGAIYSYPGSVSLTNSTVSGNSGRIGGGLFGDQAMTLTNSTVSANSASGSGGGIHFASWSLLTFRAAVGPAVPQGVTNTLIAGNSNGNCAFRFDSLDSLASGGHNLDDDGTCGLTAEGDLSNVDAHLAPLGDYGGPTETHALCIGEGMPDPSCTAASPALEAGDEAACPDTDQRGGSRPQPFDGVCDIGAYEANVPFNVTKSDDTNDGFCDADCSLREAIIATNALPGADVVMVPAGTYLLTLEGGDDDEAVGDLDIEGDLTLTGSGSEATIIDGNGIDRVFEITGEVVSISGVTIQNGSARDGGGILKLGGTLTMTDSTVTANTAEDSGGGIFAGAGLTIIGSAITGNTAVAGGGMSTGDHDGPVWLTNSTIGDNFAEMLGGGILNFGGDLTLTSCTVESNSAGRSGGGVLNFRGDSTLTLANTTLSGNSAGEDGGGLGNLGGSATLTSCTLSGNSAVAGGGIYHDAGTTTLTNTIVANSPSGADCAVSGDRAITPAGHNLDTDGSCALTGEGDLSNVDAHLAPLGDYGGPTETHALCTGPGIPDASCMAASPALDAGDNDACPDTDQRGVERPQPPGGVCDIGAYEAE